MKKTRGRLIIEDLELGDSYSLNGINSRIEKHKGCTITYVNIDSEEQARKINRDIGKYITIETDKVHKITDSDFESIVNLTAKVIKNIINVSEQGRILILGLGNRDITPDSLGPKCIDRIIVTRGLEKEMPEIIGYNGFSNVSAISTNVFGVTGIESAEIAKGIANVLNPQLIIVIDALSTVSLTRLCKTIQISNTALIPGGGINNSREEISSENLDVPTISIGMPTVADTKSILNEAGLSENSLGDYANSLIITPSNIDIATDTAAKLIAFSINKALHYDLSTEEILKFLY